MYAHVTTIDAKKSCFKYWVVNGTLGTRGSRRPKKKQTNKQTHKTNKQKTPQKTKPKQNIDNRSKNLSKTTKQLRKNLISWYLEKTMIISLCKIYKT